ncbi:hypothetical protein [Paludibacterium denitrificans]|uniref:Uncharacterized protein n=1 Tax=Paludibacterium denitrificans TaxID=2675226 RepID=A0A844GAI1_9NEIS|nr:hypothetical protein [Paludibacterium denitrificans]MTD32639.1 hypothetical protein [Paludibacterium denitrificans]
MSLTFGFYQDEARHQPLDSLVLSGGACRRYGWEQMAAKRPCQRWIAA